MSCTSVPRSRYFTVAVLVIKVIEVVSRMPTIPGTMNVARMGGELRPGDRRP